MNAEQTFAFNTIWRSITTSNMTTETTAEPQSHDTQPIFLEGKPGHGKTFIVDAIYSKLRSEGKIVLIVGTSALAAALHERGRTAHNLFGIPVTEVGTKFSTN